MYDSFLSPPSFIDKQPNNKTLVKFPHSTLQNHFNINVINLKIINLE